MSDVGSEAGERKPAGGRSRWLVPALVVSLALNLLVVGMIVADHLRPHHRGRMAGPSFSEILPRNFFRELPDARRAEFRAVFQRNRPAFREDRQALRDSALAVADRLSAQPYDDAATRDAIDTYGKRSQELLGLGMTIAKEVVAGLTPEERQALSSHIRKRAEQRRSRRDRKESDSKAESSRDSDE